MFIFCILLAATVGWLVDSANLPQPLWESQGRYADVESPLIYSRPWLVTVSPHEKQLKVWDLSKSKSVPVRSTQLMSADGRLHSFGNELIDHEFYFLERHELKPGHMTQLKKWNILSGQLSTVCSRSSSSERSQVLLSIDGSRMFSSEEMPIGHLSLLAPPSLGSVVSASFVDWSVKTDKTCFLHPHRVEVIDCRNGETISQFIVPAFHSPITRNQLSGDGKWLASVAKLPSFWCQASKVMDIAAAQREIVIYNTVQGAIASKVPFGKQFPFPMNWVGDYLYVGKATQAYYQSENICYISDGSSKPVLVEPSGGETLHVFNNEAVLSSYCTKEKLVFNTTSNVVEVEFRAGLSQKDAFEARKVYDHSHLNPSNYHMQLVHGTTQLAMQRHAQANSRWPRITSFLYRYNMSDWGRFLPEYHSIEVYDYVTGQHHELARSTSINQDIGFCSAPSNLVNITRFLDNRIEYQLWSSEMPKWNIGYSSIIALLLLLVLLRLTHKRRVKQMHG